MRHLFGVALHPVERQIQCCGIPIDVCKGSVAMFMVVDTAPSIRSMTKDRCQA